MDNQLEEMRTVATELVDGFIDNRVPELSNYIDGVNEVRAVAIHTVQEFINNRIPLITNAINGEKDFHRLHNFIVWFNNINGNITNPAIFEEDADMDVRRNRIFYFLKKAYEMVDDPSTDSIISWAPHGRSFVVWKPLECSRDLLTKYLEITNFARFETYGFRKIVVSCGQQLEFACNDFVKGRPDLLEKIGERYVAKLNERRQRVEDQIQRTNI